MFVKCSETFANIKTQHKSLQLMFFFMFTKVWKMFRSGWCYYNINELQRVLQNYCTYVHISDNICLEVARWGILSKISSNYALNICLITFAWKLHQICEHRCNNFEALIVIHWYCNSIPARTKHFSHFCEHKKNINWRLLCCVFMFANVSEHLTNMWKTFGLGLDGF